MDEFARALLIELIRGMIAPEFDMAAHRRKLLDASRKIEAMRDMLDDFGPIQEAIEDEFEQAEGPLSYRVTVAQIARLAQAAQRAAGALPPAQRRPAMAFAAAAWLHLASLEMNGPPSLYDKGAAVKALKAICDEAGLVRSTDDVRKALTAAVKQFDPHCPRPDVARFLDKLSGRDSGKE